MRTLNDLTSMNRRDWIRAASLSAAALGLPLEAICAPTANGPAQLETEIKRLKLRHTWTTTMSSSDFRDTLHLR